MAKGPVFLERQSYRKRRLRDAIRFLPFLGLLIFMVPLLWPQPDSAEEGVKTSVALRYLFGAWLVLVLFGAVFWSQSRRTNLQLQNSED